MKVSKILTVATICCSMFFSTMAQRNNNDTAVDTLNCPIISFNFAPVLGMGDINDMFTSPMLEFGVSALYKTKTNWVFGVEGSFFFGNDNLEIIYLGYCAQAMQDMRVHNRPNTTTCGTAGNAFWNALIPTT